MQGRYGFFADIPCVCVCVFFFSCFLLTCFYLPYRTRATSRAGSESGGTHPKSPTLGKRIQRPKNSEKMRPRSMHQNTDFRRAWVARERSSSALDTTRRAWWTFHNRVCAGPGRTMHPSSGISGTRKAEFCSRHAKEGMINAYVVVKGVRSPWLHDPRVVLYVAGTSTKTGELCA